MYKMLDANVLALNSIKDSITQKFMCWEIANFLCNILCLLLTYMLLVRNFELLSRLFLHFPEETVEDNILFAGKWINHMKKSPANIMPKYCYAVVL